MEIEQAESFEALKQLLHPQITLAAVDVLVLELLKGIIQASYHFDLPLLS